MDTPINIAVPDISVLSQSAAVQVSEIAPGMLTQMLDMITYDQMNTYTLCVDGKKINVSSSEVDGEVNLFGFEDKSTFQENRDRLMTEMSMIREMDNLLMSFQRPNKVYIPEIPGEQNSLKEKLRERIKNAGNAIQNLRKTKIKLLYSTGLVRTEGIKCNENLVYLVYN